MAHPKKKTLKIEMADRAAVDYIIAAINIAGDRLRHPAVVLKYSAQNVLEDVVTVLQACDRERIVDVDRMIVRITRQQRDDNVRKQLPWSYWETIHDIAKLALWAVTPNTLFGAAAADLKQLIKILEDKV